MPLAHSATIWRPLHFTTKIASLFIREDLQYCQRQFNIMAGHSAIILNACVYSQWLIDWEWFHVWNGTRFREATDYSSGWYKCCPKYRIEWENWFLFIIKCVCVKKCAIYGKLVIGYTTPKLNKLRKCSIARPKIHRTSLLLLVCLRPNNIKRVTDEYEWSNLKFAHCLIILLEFFSHNFLTHMKNSVTY